MKTAPPKILHLTESLTRVGGMEVFVNAWLRADADSSAATLLDSQQRLNSLGRQTGLRPNRLYSLSGIRNQAKNLQLRCGTLICHNFAGLSALSDLIAHERLVVYLHTNSPDVWPRVLRLAPYVDAIVACGTILEKEVEQLLRDSPVTVAAFESPLDDAFFRAPRIRKGGQILIGYAGRLVVEQKRVERLKEFCEALTGLGVDFRLQITGDGPDKAMLARRLAPFPVDFLGLLKWEQVPATFAAWDFQIITSDYETGPLTAMEGMACGVIPIFPDIPCQAADVLRGAFDRLFYSVGNMPEAARQLQAAASLAPAQLELLRSDLRRLMAPKSMAYHLQATRKILEEIHAKPSLRRRIHFQSCWKDHLPLAIRCRLSGGSEFLK